MRGQKGRGDSVHGLSLDKHDTSAKAKAARQAAVACLSRLSVYWEPVHQGSCTDTQPDKMLLGPSGQSGYSRLAVGSLVFVNDALGDSFVQQSAGVFGQSLGFFIVADRYGFVYSAHRSFQTTLDSPVALPGFFVGQNSFFLAFDVRHVFILVYLLTFVFCTGKTSLRIVP